MPDPTKMSREELEKAYRDRTAQANEPATATKAHFAAGSSALATVVITWLLGRYVPDMPPEVQAAVSGLLIGAISWSATYFAPANRVKA